VLAQADVQEHGIGLQAGRSVHRLDRVAGLPDDRVTAMLEQLASDLAKCALVIDDQHARRHVAIDGADPTPRHPYRNCAI
jgi:hypothetical protein